MAQSKKWILEIALAAAIVMACIMATVVPSMAHAEGAETTGGAEATGAVAAEGAETTATQVNGTVETLDASGNAETAAGTTSAEPEVSTMGIEAAGVVGATYDVYAVSHGYGYIKATPYNVAAGETVTIKVTNEWNDTKCSLSYNELVSKLVFHSNPPLGIVNDVNAVCSADNPNAVVSQSDYLTTTYKPADFIFAFINVDNGEDVSLTKVDDVTYTFTMPASNVQVVAYFDGTKSEPAEARTSMTGKNNANGFQDNMQEQESGQQGGTVIVGRTNVAYHPLSFENVFDFTDGKTIQINKSDKATYGTSLIGVFGLSESFSGTKQLSLAETNFYIPSTVTEAQANQKMFEVTGDGNGNFAVKCLLSSSTVVTTDYFTPKAETSKDPAYQMTYGLIGDEIKSKQVDTYTTSPHYEDGVTGYSYISRRTYVDEYMQSYSFAFKYSDAPAQTQQQPEATADASKNVVAKTGDSNTAGWLLIALASAGIALTCCVAANRIGATGRSKKTGRWWNC